METLPAVELCIAFVAGTACFVHAIYVRRFISRCEQHADARLVDQAQRANRQLEALLQDVQGLLYQFQAVANKLAPTEPTRGVLLRTLDYADALLSKARERTQDLTQAPRSQEALEELLTKVATKWARRSHKHFCMSVKGPCPPLQSLARDALLGIAEEALNNAYQHSMATHVELEVVYDVPRRLILRIRDNGCGFDVRSGHPIFPGTHLGLIGIQEQARRLRTHADIWSGPNAGTEVSVCVSADDAYFERSPSGGKAWLAAKIAAFRVSD